jgi:signal transduction histidine kinase
LARELHDSLAQTLTFIYLAAQAARSQLSEGDVTSADAALSSLAEAAQQAHHDVREYISGARLPLAAEVNLASLLDAFLNRFTRSHKLLAELEVCPSAESLRVGLYAQMQLQPILSEALTNACRHGHARHARVTLSVEDDEARLSIQDDGQGFDPARLGCQTGYGLICMRERAEAIGGHLWIESAPGMGACVTVRVPLDECTNHPEGPPCQSEY